MSNSGIGFVLAIVMPKFMAQFMLGIFTLQLSLEWFVLSNNHNDNSGMVHARDNYSMK